MQKPLLFVFPVGLIRSFRRIIAEAEGNICDRRLGSGSGPDARPDFP